MNKWAYIALAVLFSAFPAMFLAQAFKPDTTGLYRQSFAVDGQKCFVPLDGGEPFCFYNTNPMGE